MLLAVAMVVVACADDGGSSDGAAPPQTITISVEGLEGYEGFYVASFLTEADPQQRETRLAEGEGAVYLASALNVQIDDDPFSATDLMGPAGGVDPTSGLYVFNGDGVVTFEADSYAGSVEVGTPSGPMQAACSFEVEVVEGEPAVVTISSVHPYTGNGMFWGADPGSIPECSN